LAKYIIQIYDVIRVVPRRYVDLMKAQTGKLAGDELWQIWSQQR